MQEGKIYLVFEYLSMDLRKYLDQNKNEPIAPELIKVCQKVIVFKFLIYCLKFFVLFVYEHIYLIKVFQIRFV